MRIYIYGEFCYKGKVSFVPPPHEGMTEADWLNWQQMAEYRLGIPTRIIRKFLPL